MLRGINVSGQKKIKMDLLKKLYEQAGFSFVQTYIQSGNIIFSHKSDNVPEIVNIIETAIRKQFGFDVSVIIRTPQEMKKVTDSNPLNLQGDEFKRLYVTFLATSADDSKTVLFEKYKAADDKFCLLENHFYFFCPGGYGKTKLSNNIIEKVYKCPATTRNWNTVNKLQTLSSSE